MKLIKITLIILILLLFPLVSAVDFNMKTNFSQGETLMAKISGNFINPIVKENIFLYREHVRVPFEPYVEKINEEFYVYGQLLGKQPGNYSISVENVKYMKAGQVSEEKLIKNFTINDNIADFSIEPGFIISDKDFFIKAQNLQDYKIVIEIKILSSPTIPETAPEEQSIEEEKKGFFASLFGGDESEEQSSQSSSTFSTKTVNVKSGEIKKINFEIKEFSNLNLTFSFIELGTENLKYDIPTYILFKEILEKEGNLIFKPSELNVSLSTNSNTTRIIYLFNDGQEVLKNISLSAPDSLVPYVSISPNEIEELEGNSSIIVKLQINSSNEEKKLEGQITAKTSDEYAYVALSINIIKDFVPSEEDEQSLFPTCSEIGGKKCSKGEKCEGKTENAKDGVCCLGTCKKTEKSPVGKIIALILVIGIIALLIWFYRKKYKGVKRNINLLKIAQGKK